MHEYLQENSIGIDPNDEENLPWLKKHLTKIEARVNALEMVFKKPINVPLHQKSLKGEKAMLDNEFMHFLKGQPTYHQKSLTTGDGKTASIIIPSPVQEHLDRAFKDYSPLRKYARVSTIATESLEILVDKGESDVGWVQEIEGRSETKAPELVKIKIDTHEMYAKPKASQKVLDDSEVNLEQWIVERISWQMGMRENQAFLLGDGKGKPKGLLTYTIVPFGKGEWGKIEGTKTGVAGGIQTPKALFETFHALSPEYLEGAIWMMPRSALSLIRQLKDDAGRYLFQQSLIQGQESTLLGHPVVINDALPAVENGAPSILFGNFGHSYAIVDRQEMNVVRDPYSQKPYVEFYATKRVGGDVVNFDAIKVIQFAE